MTSQDELQNLHQSLSKGLLPKSNQIHGHIKEFLGSEIQDFERFNVQNDNILDSLKDQYEHYNRTISELKNKLRKDNKFVEGSTNFLKAKEDEISSKNKVLTSISTGLKQSVSKVEPQKLAKLPYEQEAILKQLFITLYTVLYNEPESKYNWNIFKEKALLHYKGEDFLTRLANINFKDLSQQHQTALLKLKSDQLFVHACQHSKYAVSIIDLADWVDYVCEGVKVGREKKQSDHEYSKILTDKEKRSGKNTQLKEQFCTETMKDIDSYQNNLIWLQSQLRTLTIGMNTSISDISELNQTRDEAIIKINDI